MNQTNHKRNWQILYSNYTGMEKKAVELISREMGSQILRDTGIYTIHVLACMQAENGLPEQNAVVIGLYRENELIRNYIAESDIAPDGYVVKVMDRPDAPGLKLVLITAKDSAALFYGAVDFVDDYFALAVPAHGPVKLADEIFDYPLPDYYHASAPAVKKRSVFTWGHPINDYRDYIENMARLKLNQLIIWNDFAPLNARDIVDYAHEFGIQIIWGYAWGWSRQCDTIDLETLDNLADQIIATYEQQYRDTGCDGIYFQSFTELAKDKIGDRLIAETVTEFVNHVSGKLLAKYPDLFIQFGLHATSVRDHLEFIGQVDPRVEILWEDCGAFPYSYYADSQDEQAWLKTVDFTDRILNLRESGGIGMLYKGFMTLDWVGDRFVHQSGPYIMGMASRRTVEHDLRVLKPIWRKLQTEWTLNGQRVLDMTRHICAAGKQNVTLGMAGQFAGGIWLPEALCAQMLWDCSLSYPEMLELVSKRRSVEIV